MTALLLAVLAASPCVVAGEDFTTRAPVSLSVDGGQPVPAMLKGVTARAVLEGRRATVLMERPVALSATAKRLRLDVKTEVSLFDGGVVLHRGTSVQWLETIGDTIAGSVLVEPDDDELETEDKPPLVSFALRGIPCSALTLDGVPADEGVPSQGDVPLFEGHTPMTLLPSPRARAASVVLTSPQPGASVFFRLLQRRGPLAFVEYVDDSGRLSLRGWLALVKLTALPAGTGVGRGAMCTGDHARSGMSGESRVGGTLRHLGPLELPAGTVLTVECATKQLPERRCPAAVVTTPLEVYARWYGEPTAEVTLEQVRLEDERFTIDAARVNWPNAGP